MDPMQLALEEARKAAEEGEIPVGAVLLRDGEVLAADHNRREQNHDPTAHAEILCLRAAAKKLGNWRLDRCTLAVTLEPCPMCAGAILNARLAMVEFGAADEEKGCCGSIYDLLTDPALHGQTRWQQNKTYESSCRALLTDFFRNKRSAPHASYIAESPRNP